MSKLTIFRGFPGSGKTSAARRLQAKTGALLLEPDMLCVENGVYIYHKLYYTHAQSCIMWMLRTIFAKECDVILADVFQSRETFFEILDPELHGAELSNYELTLIEMPSLTLAESLARNTHNVKSEDIERMISEYELLEEVCERLCQFFKRVEGVKLPDSAAVEHYFNKLQSEVKK